MIVTKWSVLTGASRKTIKRSFTTATIILLLYLTCFAYLDTYHIAIDRNIFTGENTIDSTHGFELSAPWVMVSRIDTRPMAVNIPSSARVLNRRLVQFVPAHWKEFVDMEGYEYWWWRNRYSWNFGHDEENKGIKDVFIGYAYSGVQHKFLREIKE